MNIQEAYLTTQNHTGLSAVSQLSLKHVKLLNGIISVAEGENNQTSDYLNKCK